jgi:1-acyl-sn-glycerol-3-phosphate acyltransferase
MTRAGLAARLLVQVAAFAALAPAQIVASRFGWTIGGRIPILFHRLFLHLFGVRVEVRGAAPARGAPTLVLANHVSWLDIPVMAALTPLSFVAKQEIAGWPLFGRLARLQRCVFLDRTRKAATAEVNAIVARRLTGGDAIVLFPEGTTGDGNRLLTFKSSLVGAARAALAASELDAIRLQPLAIAYVRRNGLPVTRRDRPEIAWYGDMELAPHLAAFIRGGPLDVVVTWGDPIAFGPGSNRKHATVAAEEAVRAAIRASS